MLLSPIPRSLPLPPSPLKIVRVSDEAQLLAFCKVAAKAFGMPSLMVKRIFPHLPAPTDPFVPLVGYEGDEPVATSAATVADGITGIYMVGVMPKSRRRGYGEAITWAAAQVGREKGCEVSYLQASEMGLPVYKKMGFKVVTQYPEWVSKVSTLDRVRALLYFIGMMTKG
jgi:ribosomal protein S18 acetylase RimI-like enzyme